MEGLGLLRDDWTLRILLDFAVTPELDDVFGEAGVGNWSGWAASGTFGLRDDWRAIDAMNEVGNGVERQLLDVVDNGAPSGDGGEVMEANVDDGDCSVDGTVDGDDNAAVAVVVVVDVGNWTRKERGNVSWGVLVVVAAGEKKIDSPIEVSSLE